MDVYDYYVVFDTIGGDTYKRSFKVLKGGIIISMLQQPNLELMQQYGVKEDLSFSDRKINAAILSETTLLDEIGYIQRDSSTSRIRLFRFGRLMCSTNRVLEELDR